MSYIAIVGISLIALLKIPVSLMPNVDVPAITVHVNYKNISARELQNLIVKPLKSQLLQVSKLSDIEARAFDGHAIIKMRFEYGTKTHYAYIETNEKIDAVMSMMPRDFERPRVIKASISDIPVFNLNISLKTDTVSEKRFLELSEFTQTVLQKRIEQLKGIAFTDITGLSKSQIEIVPDFDVMHSLNLSVADIEKTLSENNFDYGNVRVKNGQYVYDLKFINRLQNVGHINKLYLKAGNKIISLKDIAKISLKSEKTEGLYAYNGKRAILVQLIKQSDARLENMEKNLSELISQLKLQYPYLIFDVSQNQTELLDVSISNLQQSLLLGILFAVLIMFIFQKNIYTSLLIGISIPVSILISIFFLYLFNISINIISLSGLILGVGLMIDNAIIVIDNITQKQTKEQHVANACINGTNEVIRPLISSALTTSAIFLPLVFLSGIAGVLFFDQAVSVSTGLAISLLVSITLIPTLYFIILKKANNKEKTREKLFFEKIYEKGYFFTFANKKKSLLIFIFITISAIVLLKIVNKESLPVLSQNDVVCTINWNQNISLSENKLRVEKLRKSLANDIDKFGALMGQQQFMYNNDYELRVSEAEIYIKSTKQDIEIIKNHIHKFLKQYYTLAKVGFKPAETIYQKIFAAKQLQILKIRASDYSELHFPEKINKSLNKINNKLLFLSADPVSMTALKHIKINRNKLLLYNIDYKTVLNKLKSTFDKRGLSVINSNNFIIPVVLKKNEDDFLQQIKNTVVVSKNKSVYPLHALIEISDKEDFKTVYSDKTSEYIPIPINEKQTQLIDLKQINRVLSSLGFVSTLKNDAQVLSELLKILIFSLVLLYFILAIQFESLTQPFIVLLEIPADITGTLLFLLVFGSSLNLMSGIGIVVMSGIVINDSILKIDTINRIRKSGQPLLEAIHTGGLQRVKPILMTSATTVLALLPLLFMSGLGAELQLPLALAVIGGMVFGTIISLYFIPLVYWFIYKN